MLEIAEAATNRREFLVRSAATAAGAFMSIGLPVLDSEAAEAPRACQASRRRSGSH